MKRRSIQTRVTLFYSSLLILLALFLIGFLMYTANTQAYNISRSTLERAVKEAVDDISYYEDRMEIDPDFDFYSHGVTIVMYGPQGTALIGTTPVGFPTQTPLITDEYQEIRTDTEEWTVYDLYVHHPAASGLWIRGIYSMDNTTMTLQAVQKITAIILPIILVLALLGGRWITRKAFLPVANIQKAAEEISNGHDLSRRIELHEPKDELYDLAATLNGMIERLQEAFENERQFSSDVSHELRTPVSVILSQCDYLLSASRSEADYKDGLESIRTQTKRMSSLIAQLLELSRTAGKQTLLQKEEVDLSGLCEILCEEMEEEAASRKISIRTELPSSLTAHVDQTLFMRLLINLLSNGIRYGREGGFVKVSLEEKEEHILLQVADNGIGIAEENLEKIFHRLYRADKSRTADNTESFGLGLSFVRWIAEAHGGTVTVQSIPDAGTCFTVSLPAGK